MPTHNASVVMMMPCYIFMVDDKPSTGCGHCTLLNRVQSVHARLIKRFYYYYILLLYNTILWVLVATHYRTIVGNHTLGTTMRLDFRTIGRSRTVRYNNK